MRFDDLKAGTAAVRRAPLPLINVPEGKAQEAEVGLRVLTPGELADVLERARKYAIKRGVEEPKDRDPLYELGKQYHSLAIACVDPDAKDPTADDARFFTGIEQIEKSPLLGGDCIALLHETWEIWQEQCSPAASQMDEGELLAAIAQLAEDDTPDFFVSLRPGLRWICTHTLAALVATSPEVKSRLSSNSESAGST